jgi:hypothetical protein
MGVNNKQRRAAKKKKARARGGQSRLLSPETPVLTAGDVRDLLLDVVARIWEDSAAAERCAGLLLAPGRPLTPDIARAGVRSLLADLIRTVTAHGWSPTDVVQVTARGASVEHVPLAVALLQEDVARYAPGQVPDAWSEDLRRAGQGLPVVLEDPRGMQQALEVAAVLATLPEIVPVVPAPGSTGGAGQVPAADEKLLARVQALLAKAEATEFDDEAEALSAKAQELVSRHALHRLLHRVDTGQHDQQPVRRRLWLDAPYVFPKAMLVHVVATANRSRAVASEKLGFCTLIGHPQDLDAVELLVPSLLVQAHAAMRRFGRQTDRRGTSRTRSFRQSFLLSYANRIGERLQAADDGVAASSGRGGELVPVLKRHREQIDAVCDELFPQLVEKAGTIGNALGWAAGRAAADEALIGADLQVTAAAS